MKFDLQTRNRMNSPTKSRIYLSSPHLGTQEFEFVREAFATNWIAPLGPNVDAFEREFGERLNHPTENGWTEGWPTEYTEHTEGFLTGGNGEDGRRRS